MPSSPIHITARTSFYLFLELCSLVPPLWKSLDTSLRSHNRASMWPSNSTTLPNTTEICKAVKYFKAALPPFLLNPWGMKVWNQQGLFSNKSLMPDTVWHRTKVWVYLLNGCVSVEVTKSESRLNHTNTKFLQISCSFSYAPLSSPRHLRLGIWACTLASLLITLCIVGTEWLGFPLCWVKKMWKDCSHSAQLSCLSISASSESLTHISSVCRGHVLWDFMALDMANTQGSENCPINTDASTGLLSSPLAG